MNPLALWVAQVLSSAFLAVLFLQSGLDKVFDWNGNKDYVGEVFARTPLASASTVMLAQITALEIAAGATSAFGCGALVLVHTTTLAFVGSCLAGVNILALFFGQRIAKDYAGAAGLVPYMLFCLAAVLLHGQALAAPPF